MFSVYNWRNHVRSASKDASNSIAFICRQNALYEEDFLAAAKQRVLVNDNTHVGRPEILEIPQLIRAR